MPSSETTSVEDFYPRPPRGGRLAVGPVHIEPFEFLSTPSARRATRSRAQGGQLEENFYPRPPRGGRLRVHAPGEQHIDHFYPRPPRGGRPKRVTQKGGDRRFLSTPSARRATKKKLPAAETELISIHALREEGDLLLREVFRLSLNFYPRPPRGGRHPCCQSCS